MFRFSGYVYSCVLIHFDTIISGIFTNLLSKTDVCAYILNQMFMLIL